jgi:hypothetical protein
MGVWKRLSLLATPHRLAFRSRSWVSYLEQNVVLTGVLEGSVEMTITLASPLRFVLGLNTGLVTSEQKRRLDEV